MNLNRYRRQILVKRLGEKGQHILSEKHVIILGCGRLGSNEDTPWKTTFWYDYV
jgi:molybdopterin/thiamine biosynthesis adenylyltransferase